MSDTRSPETRALYRTIRATRPVFFDERFKSWCVFRHEDARTVLTDSTRFSSDYGRLAPGSALDRIFEGSFAAQDPPRHTRLRTLVARAFSARTIADLEPRIESTANALLDAIAPAGRCELNEEFAGVLPMIVIADLLGVPKAEHAPFRGLTLEIIKNFESVVSGRPTDASSRQQLAEYLRPVIAARRAAPRSDLLSHIVEASVDGERLDDAEVVAFCKLLLVAGNTTTARLLSNMVLTLLEHPDELARVRADASLLPSAIEEVLRVRPPVATWFRVTAEDVELAGQSIPARQQVVVFLGSANQDEAVFPEPDRFDVARTPNPHLAFTAGIHFCLGATLARLEALVALRAILARLPDLELANEAPLVPYPSLQSNGVVELPLRFRAC
jgi:cytochrome P450